MQVHATVTTKSCEHRNAGDNCTTFDMPTSAPATVALAAAAVAIAATFSYKLTNSVQNGQVQERTSSMSSITLYAGAFSSDSSLSTGCVW